MQNKKRTAADGGGRGRTLLVAAMVAAAACRAERTAAPIQPPPGMDSVPIANHVLYIPTGFHIGIFRDGLNGPRFMALTENADVKARRDVQHVIRDRNAVHAR